MAAITASMVGALRAKTDAPMMECKKALTEADGDMDQAEELLRVKLGSKAGKAASRITAEGVVAASVDGSTGVIELAHSKLLMVHAYTFRNDASGYGFSDPKAEMQYYMRLGDDGVFTDFPATGVEAVAGLR